MKKRIPKDGLERFLQDSFEGHLESPSNDLWDRIEEHLPEKEKDRPILFWRWGLVALVASLVGVVVFQQLYFVKQLDKLNEKITVIESNPERGEALVQSNPKVANFKKDDLKDNPTLIPTQTQNEIKKTNPNLNTPYVSENEIKNNKQLITNNTPLSIDNVNVLLQDTNPIHKTGIVPIKQEEETNSEIRLISQSTSNPEKIAGLPIAKLKAPKSTSSFIPVLDLDLKKPSKFSLGIAIAPIYQINSIELQPRFPISPDNSHLFKRKIESYGMQTALNFGFQINKSWSFKSGMAYQQLQSNFIHKPRLKFEDRLQDTNSPEGSHDFEYNVITSSGLVGLELRVDQTDPSNSLNPEESVPLSLETKQTFHYLTMPLLVNYQIGLGNWNLFLQGGFQGRWLVDHNFEIKNIESLSSKLTSSMDRKDRSQLNPPKDIALDYMTGVGLAFHINPDWKLQTSFNYTGSILNISPPQVINNQQSSFKLELGLSHQF